jgi:hypothetical protein
MFVYQGFLKTGMPGKLGLALHLHQIGRLENLYDTYFHTGILCYRSLFLLFEPHDLRGRR